MTTQEIVEVWRTGHFAWAVATGKEISIFRTRAEALETAYQIKGNPRRLVENTGKGAAILRAHIAWWINVIEVPNVRSILESDRVFSAYGGTSTDDIFEYAVNAERSGFYDKAYQMLRFLEAVYHYSGSNADAGRAHRDVFALNMSKDEKNEIIWRLVDAVPQACPATFHQISFLDFWYSYSVNSIDDSLAKCVRLAKCRNDIAEIIRMFGISSVQNTGVSLMPKEAWMTALFCLVGRCDHEFFNKVTDLQMITVLRDLDTLPQDLKDYVSCPIKAC